MKIISKTTNKPHIYKIVCIPTGEFYYGVHNGNNTEGYTSSGVLVEKKIQKYGIENFTKEILLTFDTEDEAYEYEAVIVNKKMIRKNNPKSMNLQEGGKGFTSERAKECGYITLEKRGEEGHKEFSRKGANAINAKLKAEGRKTEVVVEAGKLSWKGFNTPEERSKENKRRQLSITKETRIKTSKSGGKAAAKSPSGMNNIKKQCPHCPMACNAGLYSRYHGDMCKHNPLSVRYKGKK